MENKTKWYYSSPMIIIFLLLFFPVGLFLMWKKSHWNKFVKLGITSFFALILIIMFSSPGTKQSSEDLKPDSVIEEESKSTDAPIPSPLLTETPKETLKPIENMKIDVTSQIVKKVDKKYRYFFDIRNNDNSSFQGEVTIQLFNDLYTSPLGKEIFNTKEPIEPGMGDSVYFDINTGPIIVHGEAGITKYKFEVKRNGQTINSGEASITSKYEDPASF